MDAQILKTAIGTTKVAFECGLTQLPSFVTDRRVVVLTDAHLAAIYMEDLRDFETLLIPRGEQAKSMANIEKAAMKLLAKGADRSTMLVGFGGGSVCDFTGFLASIYKRGIPFGFVPTTLLAQVDAAIGGKNGVDLGATKNMLGVFNAPAFVLIDPVYCRTLTEEEIRNGFAETIKHALIADSSFFAFLHSNRNALLNQKENEFFECVQRAAMIKMHVVLQDAKETGERKKLNFGHTIAHAIERILQIPHGQAVSIGMAADLTLSQKLGLLSEEAVREAIDLIWAFGLPTENPSVIDEYWPLLLQDKKSINEEIDYIFLESIGNARIERMPFDRLKSLMG